MQVKAMADYTVDEMRPFLPKAKGCSLSKDTSRHFRFQVSYPNEVSPFSKSCAWNNNVTQREAVLTCLRWAWDCHEALHPGEVRPWDLSA
eukprot:2096983-Alexandrium_andersonii.AAC.1